MNNIINNEKLILNLYKQSIEEIIINPNFNIIKNYTGLDIISNIDINKHSIIINFEIYEIIDYKLIDKYKAYVIKDKFIYKGLGMLLNNKDNKHECNCDIDFNNNTLIAIKNIHKGDILRLCYYNHDEDYPIIPEEIIDIRNKFNIKL